jgi:flagellar biosynthesis chaperone FliJ
VQRRSNEHGRRAELVSAQRRLEQAEHHLSALESEFVRACRDIGRAGVAPVAHLERAVAAARGAVLFCRTETDGLRAHALAAVRQREAAEALKARRTAESAARQARKEERELDEANQA